MTENKQLSPEAQAVLDAINDPDDRDGQTCTKCGAGHYTETSIYDDWDGLLHCTNKECNHEVKRYKWEDEPKPKPEPQGVAVSAKAQVVRRDIAQIMHELHQRCRVSISATDTLPITLETNDASLQAGINNLCAGALRAAADQAIPMTKTPWGSTIVPVLTAQESREKILAIADELNTL